MLKQLIGMVACSVIVLSHASDNAKWESGVNKNLTSSNQASFILTLLNNAESILKDAKKYASAQISHFDSKPHCEKPMDCFEIKQQNRWAKSGIYKIWPRSRLSTSFLNVYCDMEDEEGSWTVIQRRGDFDSGKDYFFQNWSNYKSGFGDLRKDFWIGNDNIFALTNQRMNIVKFTLTDWEGNSTYAVYDEFWIDDDMNKYTMHVKGYRGTAGDSFSGTNGIPFTTKDRDNDSYEKNCAVQFKGAWWYTACHASNLNGLYLKGPHESHADGVEWQLFRGHKYSLKDTVIKIRPRDAMVSQLDATVVS